MISNNLYFKLYAKYYQAGKNIKAGEYSIAAGTDPIALLKQFSSGDVVRHNVSFIEGSSVKELRAQLLKHKDVLVLKSTLMSESEILQAIGAKEKKTRRVVAG